MVLCDLHYARKVGQRTHSCVSGYPVIPVGFFERFVSDVMRCTCRRCYKCGKAFVKEEGCNKMQCSCGAKMCYVCRKPVSDYSHFNGQGGTEYQKCPLYSTNDELHVDLVEKVAEQAKAEILKANPDKTLKHDPTMVLPERTYDDPMPGMNRGAGLVAGLVMTHFRPARCSFALS